MLILVRFEESIDGNGHRADLDCAKKAVKKFGNVGNQQKNALFGAHTQPMQRVAYAVCLLQKMTIGDTFVAAFNRDFFSSAFGNIAINKVSGEVELFRQIKQGGEVPERAGISCASQYPPAGGIIARGNFRLL